MAGAEFPGLSRLAATPEKVLADIRKIVADVVKEMEASGEKAPLPIACKFFSGKFMVRVPPDVHRGWHRQLVAGAIRDI